jgi:hypothetical protein
LTVEHNEFTSLRRYSWAAVTMTIIHRDIQSIIDSYMTTFTSDVWKGQQEYIWPGTKDTSIRYADWWERMSNFQGRFEKAVSDLEHQLDKGVQLRKEVYRLRDQLVIGTSVIASRKTVVLSEVHIPLDTTLRP